MNKFSIREAIAVGFQTTFKNYGLLLKLGLVWIGLSIVFSAIQTYVQSGNDSLGLAFILAITISIFNSLWLQPVMTMGSMKIMLNLVDGKESSLSTLFDFKGLWLRYLGAGILAGLVFLPFVIGVMVASLLVIPSVQSFEPSLWIVFALLGVSFVLAALLVGVRLFFYPYLIIDKGDTAVGSIKHSWRISKGSVTHLILFSLACVFVNILGAIPLFLGLLITIPATYLAAAKVYRELSK